MDVSVELVLADWRKAPIRAESRSEAEGPGRRPKPKEERRSGSIFWKSSGATCKRTIQDHKNGKSHGDALKKVETFQQQDMGSMVHGGVHNQ